MGEQRNRRYQGWHLEYHLDPWWKAGLLTELGDSAEGASKDVEMVPRQAAAQARCPQRALRYDLRVPPEHERRGCPSTPPVPLPQQQACCPAHPCGRCLCASTRVPTGSLLFSYTAWVAASSVCPWSLRLHRDVTCAPSPTPQVASVRGSYKRHLNTPLWVTVTANPAR